MNVILNFIFLQCFETEIQSPYSDYKIFSYQEQNHSSITLFTICVFECLMNMSSYGVPNLTYGPLTLNIITLTTSHKINQAILIICVYALKRNNQAKLYLPRTFQTSDIELFSPKIET